MSKTLTGLVRDGDGAVATNGGCNDDVTNTNDFAEDASRTSSETLDDVAPVDNGAVATSKGGSFVVAGTVTLSSPSL